MMTAFLHCPRLMEHTSWRLTVTSLTSTLASPQACAGIGKVIAPCAVDVAAIYDTFNWLTLAVSGLNRPYKSCQTDRSSVHIPDRIDDLGNTKEIEGICFSSRIKFEID